MHSFELVYRKDYSNPAKMFWAFQNDNKLNRGLSSNFWELRSANHVKFTEEFVMYTEKHILVKKMFTNELNMGLLLWARVKKIVHGVETHWLSRKRKHPGCYD